MTKSEGFPLSGVEPAYLALALLASGCLLRIWTPLGPALAALQVGALVLASGSSKPRAVWTVLWIGSLLLGTSLAVATFTGPGTSAPMSTAREFGSALVALWVGGLWAWDRRRMVARVAESTERTQAILDTADDAIVLIDERGLIESINRRAEELFGRTFDDLCGRNVAILMPEPHAAGHDSYLQRYRETGEARIMGVGRDVVALHSSGRTFPVRLTIGEVRIAGRRFFTGFVHDITALRRAEKVAMEDPLTGLANRRAFDELIGGVLPRSSSSLLMLDVDHFKAVNDDLGHAAGDRALVTTASRIQGHLRVAERSLCARVGGDEFAILLPDTSIEAAEQIGARIVEGVGSALGELHPGCGVSVGVAWADAGETPAALLARADAALYRAKEARGVVSR